MTMDEWTAKKSREVVRRLCDSLRGIHLTPDDAREALQYIYMACPAGITQAQVIDTLKAVQRPDGRKFKEV